MRLGRVNKIEKPSGDTFNLSISDLMSTLLAIFILVTCCLLVNMKNAIKDKEEALLEQKAKVERNLAATKQLIDTNVTNRRKILQKIASEMQQAKGNYGGYANFDVQFDYDRGTMHIKDKGGSYLFDSGSAELRPEAQFLFQKLSHVLEEILADEHYRKSIETIFIEGHTDDAVIHTLRYPSNWQLSADRSIQTLDYMDRCDGGNLKSRKNAKGEYIFSCSGYAASRPIDAMSIKYREYYRERNDLQAYEDGMARNRRIDIRFAMTSITADAVEKLEQQMRAVK